jgi:hypothetical protein
LVLLPFEPRTWDLAAAKGNEVATCYWNNTPPFTRGDDEGEATHAVRMLLRHRRPAAAFHVLRMALHHKVAFESGLLMDSLQGWLEAASSAEKPSQPQGIEYDIHLLFQTLQRELQGENPNVNIQRLAQLEWAYLGALDGHPASPVTLHGLLRDQPDFFVDILGLIFRPKNEVRENTPEPSEEENRRIQSAYRLLMAWQDVPGQRKDGMIDEEALLAWMNTARSLAKERDLLEIADSRIGQVFAYAQEDPDGSWPCLPVRDALEEMDSDDGFGGFGVGIYNKRGIFSKSLREGGEQERELAKKYRHFAERCQVDWPRTAAALRRVAEGYEEEARRADSKAMLD